MHRTMWIRRRERDFTWRKADVLEIVELWEKYHREQSRANLVNQNGLERSGLVRLPDCSDSLGEKRVSKADGEHGERILGRAGK